MKKWSDYVDELRGKKPNGSPSSLDGTLILDTAMCMKARWDQRTGQVTRDDMDLVVKATSQMWAMAEGLSKAPSRYRDSRRTALEWFNFLTGLGAREVELDMTPDNSFPWSV